MTRTRSTFDLAAWLLHDGEMPLRQLGLGSKRMLTTGLQTQTLRAQHVTLFDEVELGLEPHRIARLIEHLKADTTGQYFLTTHSPVVLRELTVEDLHIVHCRKGANTDCRGETASDRGFRSGKDPAPVRKRFWRRRLLLAKGRRKQVSSADSTATGPRET